MEDSGSIERNWKVLKQREVKAMVRVTVKPQDKAVISFLAQTGQRVGVLTAITWRMIRPLDSHGIASIPSRLDDKDGWNVRKGKTPHKYVIGTDTMNLLEKMPKTKQRRKEGGFVFDLSYRSMERAVERAARDANTQDWQPRRIPHRVSHKVHPHSLRVYWKDRVTNAPAAKRMDPIQSKHMMGRRPPASETYDRGLLEEDNLLKAYRRVEGRLRVL